ncbi:tigger transposable element-derived protein 2-like [Ochlerotatus camptorhynchus]|uniref:tigger transposable element-derived protein 2-like n=1 Tax=Ochlerotatus camptorhynchus TaxID=644619 RepID=UPI0031DD5FD1
MEGVSASSSGVDNKQVVKRKHTTLTLAQKVRIIEEFEAGNGSHEMLGKRFGVRASSVGRFLKNKESIRMKLEKFREHGVENRKTMKEQNFPLMEEALYLWVLQQREANIIVTLDVIKAKAEQLFQCFQDLGVYLDLAFLISDGWVRRFKQRFGLRSAHEEIASGRKLNKTRFTFMPCSNMDGSLKMKLMFIGVAENPRGFPRGFQQSLPVSYYNSKKAWMTRQLFRTWFYDEFIPAVRKFSAEHDLEPSALLVLDNCTAHYDGCDDLKSDDGLIQVMYLPPNVTAECQPMDQSVINAIKTRYKRKLMLKLVLENEDLPLEQRVNNVSLRQSIDWIAEAWDEISQVTIENSWKKLFDEFPGCEWSMSEQAEDLFADFKSLVASIDGIAGTNTTDEQIQLWLEDRVVDSNGTTVSITSEVFRDEEIVSAVLNKADDLTFTEEEWLDTTPEALNGSALATENEEPEDIDFPTAMKSLDNVIQFVQNNPAQTLKLKTLRTELLEAEWKRRNL